MPVLKATTIIMPISPAYRQRLYPHLDAIAAHFGTPFHIYDARGIRETVQTLHAAFADLDFREYFAVKALPNPRILSLLRELGCGFDCSSVPELVLARQVGAAPQEIMFTSNNTTRAEFAAALADGGSLLNLDDESLLDKLPQLPACLSFRLNPGSEMGNAIIGKPLEAKFGVPRERIVAVYREAQARGVQRFGLHTMVVSNERDVSVHLASVTALLSVAQSIEAALGQQLTFINIGGGLGIPYHPDDAPLDLDALAAGIREQWPRGTALYMEAGRYITGPHGVLVTRVVNRKASYRQYVGVDANMSALMRPSMYGAYHHIEVLGAAETTPTEIVDVVGSLCENNDKFAIQRELPRVTEGDLLVIHDTGAHGSAMGFTYNGRLRPQELLLRDDGSVVRIRRAETLADYVATLTHNGATLQL